MKYVAIIAAVVAASAFAVSPASSKMSMCSGDHLSKMTTMSSGMPDGPHKWEMYKHLEMVNTAMAKDGIRGCETAMRSMHRDHTHGQHMHMHQMKHKKAM
jgi:hypothetical protein